MRDANDAINTFVANREVGMLLFHDHYGDRPGGFGIFSVETDAELAALREDGALEGRSVRRHPLIFADGQSAARPSIDLDSIGCGRAQLRGVSLQ